jgi:hypothetical protein
MLVHEKRMMLYDNAANPLAEVVLNFLAGITGGAEHTPA